MYIKANYCSTPTVAVSNNSIKIHRQKCLVSPVAVVLGQAQSKSKLSSNVAINSRSRADSFNTLTVGPVNIKPIVAWDSICSILALYPRGFQSTRLKALILHWFSNSTRCHLQLGVTQHLKLKLKSFPTSVCPFNSYQHSVSTFIES